MDRFVCVRLVKANAMDLSLFQFDYDLTFAVVFMNADQTVYGRYGTRSSRHGEEDISLKGFAAALRGALTLHRRYPDNKGLLVGKQPVATEYKTPDDLPSLRGKYRANLDYAGQVVRSCLHCHQVRDAQREVYRRAGQPIPDGLMFPYPMPQVVGLTLDPDSRARVAAVEAGSPAAKAGFQAGDEIATLGGQAILSMADVQWVLQNAGPQAQLVSRIRRGNEHHDITLVLQDGWRHATDISWRVSSWALRRMGTGGLLVEPLPAAARRRAGLPEQGAMALLVKHVGQFGPHGAAKQAGFQKGDVLIAFDGRTDLMTESALLAYAAQNTRPGQRVEVRVLRGRRRISLDLPMQN